MPVHNFHKKDIGKIFFIIPDRDGVTDPDLYGKTVTVESVDSKRATVDSAGEMRIIGYFLQKSRKSSDWHRRDVCTSSLGHIGSPCALCDYEEIYLPVDV